MVTFHLLISLVRVQFLCPMPGISALLSHKASMLDHLYPHKLLTKIKWPSAVTRLTAHCSCGLMSDLMICQQCKEMVIHDTECPYRDKVPLNSKRSRQTINGEHNPHKSRQLGIKDKYFSFNVKLVKINACLS